MAPDGNGGAQQVDLPTPLWEARCTLEVGQHGGSELCLTLLGKWLCSMSTSWPQREKLQRVKLLGPQYGAPSFEIQTRHDGIFTQSLQACLYMLIPLSTLFSQTTPEEKENKHY